MALGTDRSFKLADLAKIALGAAELTNEHLCVLQQLLVILLQKLNCHNEVVRFHGFPAKCIQELLKETQNCQQHNIQFKTATKFEDKYKLLEDLERKTQEIDFKMQQHFDKIRNCHKTSVFSPRKWDINTSPTEELCTLYMRKNREFCILARNASFNRQILVRVLPLIIERFSAFESKIENMKKKLQEVEKNHNKITSKLNAVEFIIQDIADVNCRLNQGSKTFREAMVETQEMLNCKLHRVTLPALKIYLERHFIDIKKQLRLLQIASEKNTITKPIINIGKKTCLSCDVGSCCQQFNKKYQTLKTIVDEKKVTCTNALQEPSIIDRMDKMEISDYKLVAPTDSRLRHFF